MTAVERSSETTGDLTNSGNFNCWRKKACSVGVRMTQVETNNGRPGWACTCELHLRPCPTEVLWVWRDWEKRHSSFVSGEKRRRKPPFAVGLNESSYFRSLFFFSVIMFVCLFLSCSTFIWHFDTFILRLKAPILIDVFREISVFLPRACVRVWLGRTA